MLHKENMFDLVHFVFVVVSFETFVKIQGLKSLLIWRKQMALNGINASRFRFRNELR